jgi:DNA-binding PadR family transcriptional regulator
VPTDALRVFFLGFVKIHVLYHCGRRPFYGQELKEELAEHGYSVSYGTLYPLLHGLCEQGFLERTARTVNGKLRKYYTLTPQGRGLLEEAKEKIVELVDEVLVGGKTE